MVIKGISFPRERLGWSGRAFVMVELVCTLWWASCSIPTITIKMERLQTVYRHLQFTCSHKCTCQIWCKYRRGLILCRTDQIKCSNHTVLPYRPGLAETPQRNKRGRKQTQTHRRPSVTAVNRPDAIFLCKWGKMRGKIDRKARETSMNALPRKQNPTKGFCLDLRVLGQASISCRTSMCMFGNH